MTSPHRTAAVVDVVYCFALLCFILYPWFEVQPFYLAKIVVIIRNEHLYAPVLRSEPEGGVWKLCEHRHISRNPRFYSCYISIRFAMTLYDVLHMCMRCWHSDNDSLKGYKNNIINNRFWDECVSSGIHRFPYTNFTPFIMAERWKKTQFIRFWSKIIDNENERYTLKSFFIHLDVYLAIGITITIIYG